MANPQRHREIIAAVITILISVVLTAGMGTFYTATAIQKNNQKFCAVLDLSATPKPKPPNDPRFQPTTEYGRQMQAYQKQIAAISAQGYKELQKLRHEYDC